jgi:DNA-binding MarR family transcriptional regulator
MTNIPLRKGEQIKYVATKSETGECVVRDPRESKPFVLAVPPRFAHRRTLSDEDVSQICRQANARLLERVVYPEQPEADSKTATQGPAKAVDLSPDELSLLIRVGVGIPKPVTQLYPDLNLSRTKGVSLAKKLEDRGLLRRHVFSTGKRGGSVTVLCTTSAGRGVLGKHGLNAPEPPIGGGSEHGLTAILITQRGREVGMAVSHEVDIGGHRIDVVWRDKRNGARTLFQIGITSPERELKNALEIVELPAAAENRFVVVARDAAFVKKLRSLIKQSDKADYLSERIEMRMVADYLELD